MEKKFINVAVLGAPNCGKSTFANVVVDSEISMVSSKPHTTREATLAIYTKDDLQIVFIDTPGISPSAKKTESKLASSARKNVNNADLCLFIFDVSKKPSMDLVEFASLINVPKFAFINKIDLVSKGRILPFIDAIKHVFTEIFCGSILNKIGTDEILKYIELKAENKEWMFADGIKSLKQINNLLNDRTQEVIFEVMNDEIPYNVEVKTTNIEEFKNKSTKIEQDIIIPKSYKHIFLGKIKTLSTKARFKISKMLKKQIHLYLTVKYL
jgi:GTP-binding protein Era